MFATDGWNIPAVGRKGFCHELHFERSSLWKFINNFETPEKCVTEMLQRRCTPQGTKPSSMLDIADTAAVDALLCAVQACPWQHGESMASFWRRVDLHMGVSKPMAQRFWQKLQKIAKRGPDATRRKQLTDERVQTVKELQRRWAAPCHSWELRHSLQGPEARVPPVVQQNGPEWVQVWNDLMPLLYAAADSGRFHGVGPSEPRLWVPSGASFVQESLDYWKEALKDFQDDYEAQQGVAQHVAVSSPCPSASAAVPAGHTPRTQPGPVDAAKRACVSKLILPDGAKRQKKLTFKLSPDS